MTFFDRMQAVDRRVLYLLLALAIGLPFAIPTPRIKPKIQSETTTFFETVEKIAADPVASKKLVILSCNYSPSTLAENRTQNEAVVAHLMRRKLKFAIIAIEPQGREQAQSVAEGLAKANDYQYGRDYVNWGFIPPAAFQNLIKAMVRDIPGSVKKDYKGTPVVDMPVMKGIQGVDDIAAIIDITPSSTLGAWVQYYQRTGKQPVPTLYCPTAVMAAEGIPYLQSGQLQGMLIGLKGAHEYETLLVDKGVITKPGLATQFAFSLSLSYILILGLILIGNIGMFAARKQESASGGNR